MQDTSWGVQASQSATLLGVDPSAVAATCMVEMQCGNNSLGLRGRATAGAGLLGPASGVALLLRGRP